MHPPAPEREGGAAREVTRPTPAPAATRAPVASTGIGPLARALGSAHLAEAGGQPPAVHQSGVRPTISQASITPVSAAVPRDKSTSPSGGDQDQHAVPGPISVAGSGVSISVDSEGAYSSPEYPDGFRWTQVITTNTDIGGPLLPTPVQFTDPKPNDDTKPFYWTDAEEVSHGGVFSDAPTRNPRPGGTVTWDAVLSLNGVNGTAVTRFDSLAYGFTVESGGKVTPKGPGSPANVDDSLAVLRRDFPGWTFS